MADVTASKLLQQNTAGEMFPCNTGDPHDWLQWEYNTVPSNLKGVEHSFITRMCAQCHLIERLDLGYVPVPVDAEPAPTQPA